MFTRGEVVLITKDKRVIWKKKVVEYGTMKKDEQKAENCIDG